MNIFKWSVAQSTSRRDQKESMESRKPPDQCVCESNLSRMTDVIWSVGFCPVDWEFIDWAALGEGGSVRLCD